MKAAAKDQYPVATSLSPAQAVGNFFNVNSPESVRDTIIYLFKAWAFCPVDKRQAFSDEEIASFLDQLIDLVAASYALHQANGAKSGAVDGGDGHD